MSTAKIINLKSFIETSTDGNYTSYQDESLAIIEGPKGVIVSSANGLHAVEVSTATTIQIAVQYNNDNTALMPEGIGEESIDTLLTKAPITEQPLAEYVQTFGDRIEANYRKLLNSIEEIGLNPDDFKK